MRLNEPVNLALEQDAKVERDGSVVDCLSVRREIDHTQYDALVVGETGCLCGCGILPRLVIGGRELEGFVKDGEVAFDWRLWGIEKALC